MPKNKFDRITLAKIKKAKRKVGDAYVRLDEATTPADLSRARTDLREALSELDDARLEDERLRRGRKDSR